MTDIDRMSRPEVRIYHELMASTGRSATELANHLDLPMSTVDGILVRGESHGHLRSIADAETKGWPRQEYAVTKEGADAVRVFLSSTRDLAKRS